MELASLKAELTALLKIATRLNFHAIGSDPVSLIAKRLRDDITAATEEAAKSAHALKNKPTENKEQS